MFAGPSLYPNMPYFKCRWSFTTSMPAVWESHFGFLKELHGSPIVIGELGGFCGERHRCASRGRGRPEDAKLKDDENCRRRADDDSDVATDEDGDLGERGALLSMHSTNVSFDELLKIQPRHLGEAAPPAPPPYPAPPPSPKPPPYWCKEPKDRDWQHWAAAYAAERGIGVFYFGLNPNVMQPRLNAHP